MPRARRLPSRRACAILTVAAFALGGCGGEKQQAKPPPPVVGIVAVQPTTVPLDIELPGRTAPFLTSDVRPQVSGILLERLFTEGSLVRVGQPLYRIDPRIYRAAVGQAQGNLASARANAVTARLKAQRYTDLEKMNAVARQDADDARAAAGQASATIQQTGSALRQAEVNLGFTTIKAPISGRIGRSLVTPGALVTDGQTTALATIQTLDPIYVDIQQSATQLLALRRALRKGGALPATAPVRLKLDDGSDYGETGTLLFAEVTVDPTTGAVALRARFPNRDNLLLPGLYVRAVVTQARRTGAFLVPAQGVQHDPRGAASVLVVGPGNKIVQRPVVAPSMQGNAFVVTDGLKGGDRVVIEGAGNARPGTVVRPVAASGKPAESAAIAKPPEQGQAAAGR